MKIYFKLFIFILMSVSLMGMSRAPDEKLQARSPATGQKKSDALAESHTVKPHARINLDYKLPASFNIDQPASIVFTVINLRDADDVRVRFNLDDSLILNSAAGDINFGAATAGSKHEFQIQLTPQQNGLFYVNLFAAMLIDGKYQTRSFAVPVSVGEYDLKKLHKPVGVISEDAEGQRVISMPAIETTD